MPSPGEHKTVQSRILAYAQETGWTYFGRAETESRRGFDPDGATAEDRARTASLYFGDLLHGQVRAFNPKYKEAEGALLDEFQRLHARLHRCWITRAESRISTNEGKPFSATFPARSCT